MNACSQLNTRLILKELRCGTNSIAANAAGLPCCGRIWPPRLPVNSVWMYGMWGLRTPGTPHVHIHMSENAYPTNKVAPNTRKYKKGWTFSKYIKKDQVTDFPSLWVPLTITTIPWNNLDKSGQKKLSPSIPPFLGSLLSCWRFHWKIIFRSCHHDNLITNKKEPTTNHQIQILPPVCAART